MTPKDALKTLKTSSTDTGRARITQLESIRIIACIGIVTLHTVFSANEYFAGTVSSGENLVSRMVENNMMWAVPAFVMTTGALQLDPQRELPLRKLYGRYILRILIALIACCIVFRVFDIIMDGEEMSPVSLSLAFTELVTGRSWGHLWYLYLLIGIYILLPFYRMIAQRATKTELNYLCGAYFMFISLIPMIEGFGLNVAFYISDSIIYPLYLFLGHMIARRYICISREKAFVILAFTTAGIVVMDYMKYSMAVDIPGELFGYASPIVIIQALSVFALAFGSGRQKERSQSISGAIDSCTFGIYLIHMVFIRLLFRYMQWDPYQNLPILSLSGVIIGVFLLSLGIIWCLKKIPGIRWVL